MTKCLNAECIVIHGEKEEISREKVPCLGERKGGWRGDVGGGGWLAL